MIEVRPVDERDLSTTCVNCKQKQSTVQVTIETAVSLSLCDECARSLENSIHMHLNPGGFAGRLRVVSEPGKPTLDVYRFGNDHRKANHSPD
jgi:hypothetical protein